MRNYTQFGAWLEAQRAARDASLDEFAVVLGVDASNLSRYMNGTRAPSRKNLRLIAAALGVEKAELDAMVEADEAAKVGRSYAEQHEAGPGFAIVSATATTEVRDPRLIGLFYGVLGRWERMTEAERASVRPDDVDIPLRPPAAEDGNAAGGEPGPGDPA